MLPNMLKKMWTVFSNARTSNILLALFMVFVGSWAGFLCTEGLDSPFAHPVDYLFYFIVTISTVGYGDIIPHTTAGKFVSVLLIVCGIGLSAVIMTRVANFLYLFSIRRLKGYMSTKFEGHIVLLFSGQSLQTITQMVVEILADIDHAAAHIVVGSDNPAHNAILHDKRLYAHKVEYKLSEKIFDQQMFERTNIKAARRVVVNTADDSKTTFTCLAIHQLNPQTSIVAVIHDAENAPYCKNISNKIECVTPVQDLVAVQEMQDPGVAAVISGLMRNSVGSSIFRIDIPKGTRQMSLSECMQLLLEQKRAYIVAIGGCEKNPPADYIIEGGMWLFVSAPKRPVDIVWV